MAVIQQAIWQFDNLIFSNNLNLNSLKEEDFNFWNELLMHRALLQLDVISWYSMAWHSQSNWKASGSIKPNGGEPQPKK